MLLCVMLGHLNLATAHAGATALETKRHQVVTLVQHQDTSWQQPPSMHVYGSDSSSGADCGEEAPLSDQMSDLHMIDFGSPIMMEPNKGKLIMMSGADHSKIIGQEEPSMDHQLSPEPVQNEQQPVSDCPMANVAYDIMDHGLYFSQAKQQEAPAARVDSAMVSSALLNEGKSALAKRRRQLAAKFPIKSSKLRKPDKTSHTSVQQTPVEPDMNQLQFEQQKSLDVSQEPINIDSTFTNNNSTTVEPEQYQILQNVKSSGEHLLDQTEAKNARGSHLVTNLGSSEASDEGFVQKGPQPLNSTSVRGQRARNSFLAASNVARSLAASEQRDKDVWLSRAATNGRGGF